MRLDVHLTPGEVAPGDLSGRTVVVIDVLRATSTIVQALSAGARAVVPVGSIEEALRLANTFGRDEVLLCGERRCLPIEGFDLGNSPGDFTRERVAGKTLVMTTTNGTAALAMASAGSRVIVGALLNLGAIVEELAQSRAEPAILCAGRERHFALEDAACAGLLASRLMAAAPGDWELNDGALAAITVARGFGVTPDLFRTTAGGRDLLAVELEADLAFCAQVDTLNVLPALHERTITLSQGSTTPLANS